MGITLQIFAAVFCCTVFMTGAFAQESGNYRGTVKKEPLRNYGGSGSIEKDSGMPPETFQPQKAPAAFFEAAARNDYPAMKKFILEGVDVNARDEQGNTALHLTQSAEIVELLIKNKARVNARNKDFGMTPIFNKPKKAALLLIKAGADLGARSNKGNTPLHWYAYNNYLEGIELLLAHGADINACNDDGQGALDIAEKFCDPNVSAFLKSRGGRSCRQKG
jgi:ankyrin repeat protein